MIWWRAEPRQAERNPLRGASSGDRPEYLAAASLRGGGPERRAYLIWVPAFAGTTNLTCGTATSFTRVKADGATAEKQSGGY